MKEPMPADRRSGPLTSEEIEQLRRERLVFQNTLLRDDEGKSVFTWIGNECGAWSQDPALVKPELIAFWNRLCGKCGIVHPMNLFELASKYAEAANENDLIQLSTRLKKQGGESGRR